MMEIICGEDGLRMKDGLRTCEVKIAEKIETIINSNGCVGLRLKKGEESFNGYFHKWIDESYSCSGHLKKKSYGLVERIDGTVHKVDPECITFTDRSGN